MKKPPSPARSEAVRLRWQQPGYRENISNKLRAYWARPEVREALPDRFSKKARRSLSEAASARWKNPEYAALLKAKQKARWKEGAETRRETLFHLETCPTCGTEGAHLIMRRWHTGPNGCNGRKKK